jgi:predicted TPR repeat methyltransferase
MTTAPDPQAARDLFRQGLRHDEAGEIEDAARSFEASLALDADRASTRVHLAAARLKLGQAEDALPLLDTVLAGQPRHVDALGLRGTVRATLGRFDGALEDFDAVLGVRPQHAQARALRTRVLRELGRDAEADAGEAAAPSGDEDAQAKQFHDAAANPAATPPTAPRAYVQALFDEYAPTFDTDLLDTLDYRVPRVLGEGVTALGRRFAHAIDLGCGTGLCADWLRPLGDRLEGVDLSPGMLQRAQARGYDALHAGDIVEFLTGTAARYDLAVAADVFVYVGSLDRVFESLAPAMSEGGVFCFSVEEHTGAEPFVLRPTRRYAHSQTYLLGLAARHGFEVLRLEHAALRDHGSQPLAGLYLWLARRPSSSS